MRGAGGDNRDYEKPLISRHKPGTKAEGRTKARTGLKGESEVNRHTRAYITKGNVFWLVGQLLKEMKETDANHLEEHLRTRKSAQGTERIRIRGVPGTTPSPSDVHSPSKKEKKKVTRTRRSDDEREWGTLRMLLGRCREG